MATEQSTPVNSHPDLQAMVEGFERASAERREAIDRLLAIEDRAWQRYVTEADDALAELEANLATSTAEIRAEREATTDELRAALEKAARAWRGRAEEIRVQTHLGEMDAHDAGLHALDELEAVGHRVTALVEVIGRDTAEGAAAIRDRARRIVDDLRSGLGGLSLVAKEKDNGSKPPKRG